MANQSTHQTTAVGPEFGIEEGTGVFTARAKTSSGQTQASARMVPVTGAL